MTNQISSDFLRGSNLYLVGMMGTGKSTIGKELAKSLGYGFLDTDDVIVQTTGQSINDIFATQGEAAFRDIETQVLNEVSAYTKLVVATGGGIVVKQQNWSFLQHGLVIWLDVPVDELVKRLKQDTSRPLLKDKETDLHQKLSDLMAQRQARYAQADVKIDYQKEERRGAIATRILTTLQQIVKSPEKPNPDIN